MKKIITIGIIASVSLLAIGSISVYAYGGNPFPNFFGNNDNDRDDNGNNERNNGNNRQEDNKNDKNGNGDNRSGLNLKIDSQCHYYNYDPENSRAISGTSLDGYVDVGCLANGKQFGTWKETDLNCQNKFFNFKDIKPGDQGEDTISLHVSGDDGCGQIALKNLSSNGNACNEPETHSNDPDCRNKAPGTKENNGELDDTLQFSLWLDQGRTPGFQGKSDVGEGDNLFNEKDLMISDWQSINQFSKIEEIRKHLRLARNAFFDVCKKADPDGDGKKTKNGVCNGLPSDGRLLKDVVYYYGLAWRLPAATGNEVQTDGLGFDLSFTVKSNGSCTSCSGDSHECDRKCKD